MYIHSFRVDYDETPERDFEHPGYNFLFKTRETSMMSDVIPTKQQMIESVPVTVRDEQRKIIDFELPHVKEILKQDLLLGEEYKLPSSPSEEPYDSCLPYPINLFYPTIATQTISSDFIAAKELRSMKSFEVATKIDEDEYPVKVKSASDEKTLSIEEDKEELLKEPTETSLVIKSLSAHKYDSISSAEKSIISDEIKSEGSESSERARKLSAFKKQQFVPHEASDDEESFSIGGSYEMKDVSLKSFSEGSEENVKNVSDDDFIHIASPSTESDISEVILPASTTCPRGQQSISFHLGKEVKTTPLPNVVPSVKNSTNSSLRQNLKKKDASLIAVSNSSDNIRLDDNDAKEPSIESITSGIKSDDSAFAALCKKLDKKYSSSPTSSQLVYIEEAVKDLDK